MMPLKIACRPPAPVVLLLCAAFICLCTHATAENRDFYKILNVPKDANSQVIKKAFRRLSIRYHPDKNKGNDKARRVFINIAAAYETLSDPKLRRQYDAEREWSNLDDLFDSDSDETFGDEHAYRAGDTAGASSGGDDDYEAMYQDLFNVFAKYRGGADDLDLDLDLDMDDDGTLDFDPDDDPDLFSSRLLYKDSAFVEELGADTFQRVLRGDGVWLVKFYTLAGLSTQDEKKNQAEYVKAASRVRQLGGARKESGSDGRLGTVRAGAVNCDVHWRLCSELDVVGMPVAMLFQGAKGEEFVGKWISGELVSFVETILSSSLVYIRSPAAFHEQVFISEDMWIIYYHGACPRCEQTLRFMRRAADSLSTYSSVGYVDCRQTEDLCEEHGAAVGSLRVFGAGMKKRQAHYGGGRGIRMEVREGEDSATVVMRIVEVILKLSNHRPRDTNDRQQGHAARGRDEL